MNLLTLFILGINVAALIYVVLVDGFYLLQLVSSALSLGKHVKSRHYSDHRRFLGSENMIPISLLVPAYNEEATIVDNVLNLLSLSFPEYEIVVVNDGSKDKTLGLLIDSFSLFAMDQPYKRSLKTQKVKAVYRSLSYPNLIVLDKENGGKADALNAGINVSRYPVFVTIDADSVLEKESLVKIIMPFVTDHRVVGVGGIVRIASGCKIQNGELVSIDLSKNALVNLQTVEYLRSFLTGRIGFDAMGMLLIISGAFGAFNKQVAIDAGGYTTGCIGEDMELVLKMHRMLRERKSKYIIKFIPDPVCWTQPPETLGDLHKQRKRWQIGLIYSLLKHRNMLLNPRYGRIGMVCLPYYWVFEFLGPVLELTGYIAVPISFALGIINLNFFLGFFVVAVLYGIVLSIGALILEEHTFKKYPSIKQLVKLTFYAIIDNFGYRQLNTWYRVEALFAYRKAKHSWGSLSRTSFDGKRQAAAPQAQVRTTQQVASIRPAGKRAAEMLNRAIQKQVVNYEERIGQLTEENRKLAADLKMARSVFSDIMDEMIAVRLRAHAMEKALVAHRQRVEALERQKIELARAQTFASAMREIDEYSARIEALERQAAALSQTSFDSHADGTRFEKIDFAFPEGVELPEEAQNEAQKTMRRLYRSRETESLKKPE
jgi:cellulose synthase/poly-beta-1,6-N-acetylglucosamine synthase-like glycosyltransferase